MTPDSFRRLALSMPDAYEAPHFNRASFRVGKRIFATMQEEAKEAMIPVRPIELCYAMLKADPDKFIDHGGFTRAFGSLGLRLPKVTVKLVEPMMRAAYERAAPRPKAPRKKGLKSSSRP